MNSTREKGMIKEWAVRSESRICEDRNSFWNTYDSAKDIVEYDFQTAPELKKMFGETLSGCESVVLPLTIAAFKKKDQGIIENKQDIKEGIDKNDFTIPEFIYLF